MNGKAHSTQPGRHWIPVIVVGTLAAIVLGPNGPAGGFWGADGEDPTGGALAALAAYGLLEAVAFGIGLAFAVFGWRMLRQLGADGRLTTFTYLAIVWGLVSWWPHGSFHQAIEDDNFAGLAAIEWGFHATMLVCVLVITTFFWRVLAGDSQPAQREVTSTPVS